MDKRISVTMVLAFVLFTSSGGATTSLQFPTFPACPVGILPSSVVAGEFNKDGIPDLAVANHSSNNITILWSGGAACAVGPVSFGISFISVGEGPISLAVGDFDSNGCQDLVVANETSRDISILLGIDCKRTLRFQPGPNSPIKIPELEGEPVFAAVGDFTRDGHQDVVVVDQISDDIFVLQGDNTGRFPPPYQRFLVGNRPNSVAVLDLDGDAIQDLVVSNGLDDNIHILRGTGREDPKFEFCATVKVGLEPSYVIQSFGWGWLEFIFPELLYPVVPDFNGDGIPDLVVVNKGSHDISILLGHGDCTFQPQVKLKTHGNEPTAAILGDFDRDGDQDIAVTNSGTDNVSVFLNKSTGTQKEGNFSLRFELIGPGGEPNEKYPVGPNPSSLAKADFNRDGCWDLAVANRQSSRPQENSTVTFLFGVKNKDRDPKRKEPFCTGIFAETADPFVDPLAVNGIEVAPTTVRGPYSLAIGDVNQDAIPDAVVANQNASNLSILFAKGDGSFQEPVSLEVGKAPMTVAMGDLNRDGRQDLVVANSGSNDVDVFLGEGQERFQLTGKIKVRSPPQDVVVHDFNNDCRLDLAVAHADNVALLYGKGDGTFSDGSSWAMGFDPEVLRAKDFNGDEKPDLIALNTTSFALVVLLMKENGALEVSSEIGFMSLPRSFAIADFNADGLQDLAVTEFMHGISVFLGEGDGTFQKPLRFMVDLFPSAISASDLNRDGKQDLVVADLGSTVSALLGLGDGTFVEQQKLEVRGAPWAIALADLNGDKNPDLVTATFFADNALAVFLGNGDGTFQEAIYQKV